MKEATNVVIVKAVLYGIATISSLLKIIGLFCKRAPLKRRFSAKETYNFKEPTDRSHPIAEPLINRFFCKRALFCRVLFATPIGFLAKGPYFGRLHFCKRDLANDGAY